MRNLLLTALLVLGLGSTAAIPVAASDQAATQTNSVRHQKSRPHQAAPPFLVVGLTTDQQLGLSLAAGPGGVRAGRRGRCGRFMTGVGQ